MFVGMYDMYSNRTYFVHIGGVFMLNQYVMPFFVYSPSKKLEKKIYIMALWQMVEIFISFHGGLMVNMEYDGKCECAKKYGTWHLYSGYKIDYSYFGKNKNYCLGLQFDIPWKIVTF